MQSDSNCSICARVVVLYISNSTPYQNDPANIDEHKSLDMVTLNDKRKSQRVNPLKIGDKLLFFTSFFFILSVQRLTHDIGHCRFDRALLLFPPSSFIYAAKGGLPTDPGDRS